MSLAFPETAGTFVFNGILFEAAYRCDGPRQHQGGYDKCLKLYSGTMRDGSRVDGHSYFGDDKFLVVSAIEDGETIILELHMPLYIRSEGIFSNKDNKVILRKR